MNFSRKINRVEWIMRLRLVDKICFWGLDMVLWRRFILMFILVYRSMVNAVSLE